MRVLMIGWEFPPFYSGGLGTHVYYLTRSLARTGVDMLYVMPLQDEPVSCEWMPILQVPVEGEIGPYLEIVSGGFRADVVETRYPADLIAGAKKYAENVVKAVLEYIRVTGKTFDVIHCHDWITVLAGLKLREVLGIPLVVTIHATEFSRTADRPYDKIVEIERRAVREADLVIANSNTTKKEIVERLGGDPSKIVVIYNAIDTERFERVKLSDFKKDSKIVLFLGRLTFQKGPEFFIRAAKKVLEVEKDVKFIVAGKGYLLPALIHEAAALGIADKVLFLGYVPDEDLPKLYKIADVYVMPSVYEPFGITALEAMACGTPVIVSKSAGVTEIVQNIITVDFWDVDDLATKIISVLRYTPLKTTLSRNGYVEVRRYTWDSVADLTKQAYERVVR